MHEELIVKILNRASKFVPFENLKKLRMILDEELYHYAITPTSNELVPVNDMVNNIQLFIACKKLDGLAVRTLENYYRELMKFSFVVQKNIDQINEMDIRAYLARKSSYGNKNSTLNTVRSSLASFFQWMEDHNKIPKNPLRLVNPIKTEKRVRKFLSHEELEMLRYGCITVREKTMLEFFYSTGARVSEVSNVNISDINWSNGSLYVIGKGNKEREVYLNERSIFYLKKYLKERTDSNNVLFAGERRPYGRIGSRRFQKIFAELGKRSGINRPVHPHLLRHTFATHLLMSGVPLDVVQKLLGHEDPSTTQTYAQTAQHTVHEYHKKCAK